MTGRLSEESLKRVYDAGQQGFLYSSHEYERSMSLASSLVPTVDFKAILMASNAKQQVQALETQTLYLALKRNGLSDSLEVLDLISQDQFTRICDYDVWHKDVLSSKQLLTWLKMYAEISPKKMFERFRSLEEEYQIATLSPFLKLFTQDEYEKMSTDQQDQLYRFPSDACYYTILSDDLDLRSMIEQLMEAAMAEDMSYAMALLTHAAYMPPLESEALLAQFRKARMEEDGFVSYESALEVFVAKNPRKVKEKWTNVTCSIKGEQQSPVVFEGSVNTDKDFLEAALQWGRKKLWSESEFLDLQKGFVLLSNSLCAVADVDADDIPGLKRLLSHVRSLCSLSLEYCAEGDPLKAAQILKAEYPKTLFQAALGLIDQVRQQVCKSLAIVDEKNANSLQMNLSAYKFSRVRSILDRHFLDPLGFERVELLKGLFNRFPVLAQSKESIQGVEQIAFVTISSLEMYRSLLQKTSEVIAVIHLYSWLQGEGVDSTKKDLDRFILTGIANVLIGKTFSGKALNKTDVDQLLNLSIEQKQSQLEAFTQALDLKWKGTDIWASLFVEPYLKALLESLIAYAISAEIPEFSSRLLTACNAGETVLKALIETEI